MRVALAGAGTAATRGHVPALRRLQASGYLDVVAGADIDPEQLEAFAVAFPQAGRFCCVTDMLGGVASDVLVVAAPPSAHASLVLEAARAGRHVVCEKPLTVGHADHAAIHRVSRELPGLGLITVLQYRHAKRWRSFVDAAHVASSAGLAFDLDVEVRRTGVDAMARSGWRDDQRRSGGIIADHGVHFVAMARMISPDMEVLEAGSATKGAQELEARLRVGTRGTLRLKLTSQATVRSTSVRLSAGNSTYWWRDGWYGVTQGGRTRLEPAEALSDRAYIDSLYLPFYRNLVDGWRRPEWSVARTAETIDVSRLLVEMVARASDGSQRRSRQRAA